MARVVRKPGTMSGDPIIEGTRVLAETVLMEHRASLGERDIREIYPTLPGGCLRAVLDWSMAANDMAVGLSIPIAKARLLAAPNVER